MPRSAQLPGRPLCVAVAIVVLGAALASVCSADGPAVAPSRPHQAASTNAIASTQQLLIPVQGVRVDQLTDTFDEARAAGRRHDAIDIMAPKGTHVVASADGTVVKLFTSVRGGLTVYEFDPDATIEYYYAHLDRYAPGLAEGTKLRRGELVGFVGSSGDADPGAPHLHFEIALLGPEKHWWQATDINPYPVLTGKQTLAEARDAASGSLPAR
jgi:murein DD-endopeptidase MepM/ murein hydrolase activator NlpD